MLRSAMSTRSTSTSAGATFTAQQHASRQQPLAAVPALVPALHSNSQQHLQKPWRLELFFKTRQELQNQLPFLQKHGITRVNITNKSNDDQLLQTASLLQANILSLDLCVHYSMKYNYCRSPAETLAKLQAFHSALQQVFLQAAQGAAEGACKEQEQQQQQQQCHILLVSGGGKKKAFDSVAALQQLAKQQQQHQRKLVSSAHTTAEQQSASKRQRTAAVAAPPHSSSSSSGQPGFAVAFNPYLPDASAAAAEVLRLRAKLQTGLVGRVYLQMGTDLQRLSWGLKQLQDICSELCADTDSSSSRQPPQLFGSVFIPSKRLLAQMKFRPWSGVYLSDEYLSSVAAAEAITGQLLAAYAAAGVVPLVETAVKQDAELEHAMQLLQMSYGGQRQP